MPFQAVLAGSVAALAAAHDAASPWLPEGVALAGFVAVGPVDRPWPLAARFDNWSAVDVKALGASHLILAELPPPAVTRRLLSRAVADGVRLLLLGNGETRPLTLNDLVDEPSAAGDLVELSRHFAGKRVLVTGGGGSIGSEIARRVASFGPAQLTVFDSCELNIFNAAHALPGISLALADIRDARSVRRCFERARPDVVFHAAALKHVPLVEMFPSEGVLTNICGLRNVAEAAQACGADMVLLSTDKAADPSGAMGASKRLGELYCQALDRCGGARAIPVRLGNVLGSAGSVAPLFEAQLAAGGPLTVTDSEVSRYFVSIPQAADALLRAAASARMTPRERGTVLVIDMGEALPIVDLARAVIELAGLRPGIDVPITFTGLRAGEKLHERLFGADEHIEPDLAQGVIVAASPPRLLGELTEAMDRLALLAREGADEAVAAALFEAIATRAVDTPKRALAS
jgi:O-antigen biosynthesis protein WbqV